MMQKLGCCLLLVFLMVSSVSVAQESASITHGPLSGEVSATTVNLWARAAAAGAITFEVATDADFSDLVQTASVRVDDSTDFTGEVQISGLTPGTAYFYRAYSSDAADAVMGTFQTAPEGASAFDFVFGSCLGGQGYCRDTENGWEIFEVMAAQQPDFFVITGDSIYGSSSCASTDAQENEPGGEAVGVDLESFRARYKYHLEDPHYAAFLAQTPVFAGWDDHEVRDNYSAPFLSRIAPEVVYGGQQAFFDYFPIMGSTEEPLRLYRNFAYGAHAEFFMLDTRSYRDPIVNWDTSPVTNTAKTMLGEAQLTWLRESLAASDATWKFIVTSVPLSYPTGFPQPEVDGRDGWANNGERTGYETELLSLLYFMEANAVQNVVFLAGDTHWPYAISYDPDRDGEANFYELASSPLSAIVLPPGQVDPTFNPAVLYAEGEFQGTLFNFGQVSIAEDGTLTFRIIDSVGEQHFELVIEPEAKPVAAQ